MLIKEHDVFKLEVIFEYFAERAIVILRPRYSIIESLFFFFILIRLCENDSSNLAAV